MMKYLLLWILTVNILSVISKKDVIHRLHQIFRKPILYPKRTVQEKVYSCCDLPSGDRGICVPFYKCPVVQSWIHKKVVKHTDVYCGRLEGNQPVVCCPQGTIRQSDNKNSLFDLCKPKYNFKECGSPFISKVDLKRIYSMNETAEQFKKEGFTVVPTEMDVDKLKSFQVFNMTHIIKPPDTDVHEAVGGENARRVVTSYMALIGTVGKSARWRCGGVIINRDWILSAAHCLLETMILNGDIDYLKNELVVIRLGEYDSGNDENTADEFPLDFGIKETVIHPHYNYPSVYHDLVLLKLNKSIPYHRPDMRPICLPWEQEADRNLVGLQVTLTGWGSMVEYIVFEDEVIENEDQVNPMEVTFPNSNELTGPCRTQSGDKGLCKKIKDCPEMQSMTEQELMELSSCGWNGASTPVACCPKVITSTRTSLFDTKRPVYDFLSCGIPFDPTSLNGSLASIYKSNETAKELEEEGFTMTNMEVDEDLLMAYMMSNETHTFEKKSMPLVKRGGRGGVPARRGLATFVALIGEQKGNKPKWFCNGVIINRKWILSAAHCFVEMKPEVIRLGEYNINDNEVTDLEFPMDYGMADMIFHPDYNYPSSYHDLALIRLNSTIPYHRPDMTPVCLPWEDEVQLNLIGKQVTLLGWGANTYGGPMATVAQEVNVTIFNSSVCSSSYSKLSDYSEKFPHGIKPNTTLCAGDINGGKDSCRGDSGGPIVYQGKHGEYILAGIVSTGFGCGLREFPGIYVPILKPEYLLWIKKIAFS